MLLSPRPSPNHTFFRAGLVVDAAAGFVVPEVDNSAGIALLVFGAALCTLVDMDYNRLCRDWPTATLLAWAGSAFAGAAMCAR